MSFQGKKLSHCRIFQAIVGIYNIVARLNDSHTQLTTYVVWTAVQF